MHPLSSDEEETKPNANEKVDQGSALPGAGEEPRHAENGEVTFRANKKQVKQVVW